MKSWKKVCSGLLLAAVLMMTGMFGLLKVYAQAEGTPAGLAEASAPEDQTGAAPDSAASENAEAALLQGSGASEEVILPATEFPEEEILPADGLWEEEEIPITDELPGETVCDASRQDDGAFEAYAESVLYADTSNGLLTYGTYCRSKLSEQNGIVYDALLSQIRETADGNSSSTVYTVSMEELGLKGNYIYTKADGTEVYGFTAEDLGVDAIVENGTFSAAAKAALKEKTGYSLTTVWYALLDDLPAELYWHDKTAGVRSGSLSIAGASASSTHPAYIRFSNTDITFSFTVAQEYQAAESAGSVSVSYLTDTAKTGAALKAREKARAIVASYEGCSDYDKLCGYFNEIKKLASYNYSAASGSVSYGNPWQLIWVFDEDASTTVVCEGYAKAFQYLCDLSDFYSEDIYVYPVSGTMSAGGSSGSHMWDIIHMDDGSNYLVDVTNCDDFSIGAPDQLFLTAPSSGNAADGYTFTCGSLSVFYSYASNTTAIFSQSDLTLAANAYVPDDSATGLSIDETYEEGAAVTAVPGEDYSVTAKVLTWKEADLTYGWYGTQMDGSEVSLGSTTSRELASTFTVTAGSGVYQALRCVITDANGVQVEENFSVSYDESFLETAVTASSPVTVTYGKTAYLKISAKEVTGLSYTYAWYLVSDGSRTPMEAGNKASLKVENAAVSALYVCVVSTNFGQSCERTVQLNVAPLAPSITQTYRKSSSSARLVWSAAEGAEGYYIYRALPGGSYHFLAGTRNTNYTDNTLSSGTAYFYKIVPFAKAVDGSVVKGSGSACEKVLKDITAGSVFNLTSSGKANIFRWTLSGSYDGFYVYRAEKGGSYAFLGGTRKNGWTDSTAVTGTSYYYKLAAFEESDSGAIRKVLLPGFISIRTK